MKRIEILAPYFDGNETSYKTFVGWTTRVPGIAVLDVGGGAWTLTHIRSGAAICEFESPEHAQMMAVEYLSGVDWDRDLGDNAHHDPEYLAAFLAIVKAGGMILRTPAASSKTVNETS